VVRDFFASAEPAGLTTLDGLRLDGDVVARVAGPLAFGQFAQTAASADMAIGRVTDLDGTAVATRVDGTRVTLALDAPIQQGDVLELGDGSALGVVFVDNTSFLLGANARMVVDELVYDPSSGDTEGDEDRESEDYTAGSDDGATNVTNAGGEDDPFGVDIAFLSGCWGRTRCWMRSTSSMCRNSRTTAAGSTAAAAPNRRRRRSTTARSATSSSILSRAWTSSCSMAARSAWRKARWIRRASSSSPIPTTARIPARRRMHRCSSSLRTTATSVSTPTPPPPATASSPTCWPAMSTSATSRSANLS